MCVEVIVCYIIVVFLRHSVDRRPGLAQAVVSLVSRVVTVYVLLIV